MNSFIIPSCDLSIINRQIKKIFPQLSDFFGKNIPDVKIIKPEKSIGISQIRQIQHFLSFKPYHLNLKLVIILEAEKLTLAAQHAFLKTLEEPPLNSLIFLCSHDYQSLIQTIISRCQIVTIPVSHQDRGNRGRDQETEAFIQLFINLQNASPARKIKLLEPYSQSRETAIDFCENLIIALREVLLKKEDLEEQKKFVYSLKTIEQALKLIKQNVNQKLALENTFLGLNSGLI